MVYGSELVSYVASCFMVTFYDEGGEVNNLALRMVLRQCDLGVLES